MKKLIVGMFAMCLICSFVFAADMTEFTAAKAAYDKAKSAVVAGSVATDVQRKAIDDAKANQIKSIRSIAADLRSGKEAIAASKEIAAIDSSAEVNEWFTSCVLHYGKLIPVTDRIDAAKIICPAIITAQTSKSSWLNLYAARFGISPVKNATKFLERSVHIRQILKRPVAMDALLSQIPPGKDRLNVVSLLFSEPWTIEKCIRAFEPVGTQVSASYVQMIIKVNTGDKEAIRKALEPIRNCLGAAAVSTDTSISTVAVKRLENLLLTYDAFEIAR